jgi:hypothetical protein
MNLDIEAPFGMGDLNGFVCLLELICLLEEINIFFVMLMIL